MAKHDTHKKAAEKSDRETPATQPQTEQDSSTPTDTPGAAAEQAATSSEATVGGSNADGRGGGTETCRCVRG